MRPEQVAAGIMNFAENELLPHLEGWRIWAAGAALVLLRQRADTLLAELVGSKAGLILGLANERGEIDIDAAFEALKESTRRHGKLELDLNPLGSFTLNEADFDKLREYILAAA